MCQRPHPRREVVGEGGEKTSTDSFFFANPDTLPPIERTSSIDPKLSTLHLNEKKINPFGKTLNTKPDAS